MGLHTGFPKAPLLGVGWKGLWLGESDYPAAVILCSGVIRLEGRVSASLAMRIPGPVGRKAPDSSFAHASQGHRGRAQPIRSYFLPVSPDRVNHMRGSQASVWICSWLCLEGAGRVIDPRFFFS
jgi:hypothetical protein